MRHAIDELAREFNLTSEELHQYLPSGKQFTFVSRVGWARTYLKAAGLVSQPARSKIEITSDGRKLLTNPPAKITAKVLLAYPEFQKFQARSDKNSFNVNELSAKVTVHLDELSPGEQLESSFHLHRSSILAELLAAILRNNFEFFERIVLDLLIAMGYGGGRIDSTALTSRGSDGGIDGIINEDRLGLEKIFVQAKRWQGKVGKKEVSEFVGSLSGVKAQKGISITTSAYSSDALEYIKNIDKKVILIDGKELTELMYDYGVGVSVSRTFSIKRIDSDYFEEGE